MALDFFLEIEAEPAQEFSIAATGQDSDRCARLEDNLILGYLQTNSCTRTASRLCRWRFGCNNDIPLGMGCGSSAAGRLAAIALAVHFGELGWSPEQILEEACALEGHPDNAAACWLGGFVAAASEGRAVHVARVNPPQDWRAIVVLPPAVPGHQQGARGASGELFKRGRGREYASCFDARAWLLRRAAAICCAWR